MSTSDFYECRAQVMRATYYAVAIADLLGVMRGAGFADVQRLDGAFYQPVLAGLRPEEG